MTEDNDREGSGVIVWGCLSVLTVGTFLLGIIVGMILKWRGI